MIKLSRAISRIALFMTILVLTLSFKTYAAEILWDSYDIPSTRQKPRLLDRADLLSDSEEAALLQKLDDTSEKWSCNIVVLTVDDHNGPIQDYADDYFDYNGFGTDYNGNGILLMLSMADSEYAFSTSGSAISAFTDYGLDYLIEEMGGDLSNGNYADAFNIYVKNCDRLLDSYSKGDAVDVGSAPPRTSSDILSYIIGSIAVGLVVALFPILKMKSDLKTVKMATSAAGYNAGNVKLTVREDHFVRKTLNKTPIPRDNDSGSRGGHGGSSTHISSSGSTHGGSHGHF
jgi:uncharacterized protein